MSSEHGQFGKYKLLRRIGSGGMGEVYLAKMQGQAEFEKLVVIKRLLPKRRSEQKYINMFFAEARVTAQLNHSKIAQIYEAGYIEDTPYIAMEYVNGKSLRLVLKAAQKRQKEQHGAPNAPELEPVHIAQIFIDLCQGLDFAHNAHHLSGAAMGLIHRDVNPHNILLSYQGEVKLIDFGIAKSELTLDKTQAGTIKGTVVYMSPEQSSGRQVDRRSDIFSMGICLFEILSGSNPFQKDSMPASLEAIRQAKIPPLDSAHFPWLHMFEPIVRKSLAKNPDDRYDNCQQMAQQLQQLLLQKALPEETLSLGQYLQHLFETEIEQESRLLEQTDLALIPNIGTRPLQNFSPEASKSDAQIGENLSRISERHSEHSRSSDVHQRHPKVASDFSQKTQADKLNQTIVEDPTSAEPMQQVVPPSHVFKKMAHRWGDDLHALSREYQAYTKLKTRVLRLVHKVRLQYSKWRTVMLARWEKLGLQTKKIVIVFSLAWCVMFVFGLFQLLMILRAEDAKHTMLQPPEMLARPADIWAMPEIAQEPDDKQDLENLSDLPEHEQGAHEMPPQMPSSELNERRVSKAHRGRPEHAKSINPTGNFILQANPEGLWINDGVQTGTNFVVTKEQGVLQFEVFEGDDEDHFIIKIHYKMHARKMEYRIESEPWANVLGVGGVMLGRTPLLLQEQSTTVLEFKNPKVQATQRLSLRFRSEIHG